MIDTVLLDLDGTLLDTNYLHVEAWARALLDVGRPTPRAIIHRQIGKGADQFLPELLADSSARQRADERHGAHYATMLDHAYPLPGARELLRALSERGIGLWLATSAQPQELKRLLPKLEAEDCLAGTVCADDAAASKPAPDIFAVTLKRAGADPAHALVLGDTIWDIEAARRAGLRSVVVLTGGTFGEAELRAAGAVAVYADCTAALAAGFPNGL